MIQAPFRYMQHVSVFNFFDSFGSTTKIMAVIETKAVSAARLACHAASKTNAHGLDAKRLS